MMVPLLLAIRNHQCEHGLSMERFYRYVGISRQSFYGSVCRLEEERRMVDYICNLVEHYRSTVDSRAGSRSLFYNLAIKTRFGIGVNKFERLLSTYGLNLKPLRVRVVTTRSSMQSWNYPNLLNGRVIKDINQAVVGDLTYLYYRGKRYYLFCLTDLYSSRIVGYYVGLNMRAEDAVKALLMWIRLRGKVQGAIHHTDGGSQYFSEVYLGICGKEKVAMSCASNCLQNGYAEQINGLIKHHLLPCVQDNKTMTITKVIDRVTYVYNNLRKQERLGWMSPIEFEKNISKATCKPSVKLYKFGGSV